MSDHTVKGLEKVAVQAPPNSKFAIVSARWNAKIVDALVAGVRQSLAEAGVADEDITHVQVPGSFELPFAADRITQTGVVDAIVCIGVLIKGETMHFEYIAEAVSHGIMQLGLRRGVPVIFGVLTVLTEQQALARAGLTPEGHNHGLDWGTSAVEMALVRRM